MTRAYGVCSWKKKSESALKAAKKRLRYLTEEKYTY